MYVGIKGKKKPADGNLRFYLPYLQLATGRQRVLLQARFTFSSILKTPLGELTKRRLKALPRQRRSSVLRRVRLISAIDGSRKIDFLKNLLFYRKRETRSKRPVSRQPGCQRSTIFP